MKMLNLTDICEETLGEMRGIFPDNETQVEILEIYLVRLTAPVTGRSGEKVREVKLVKARVGTVEKYYLQKPDSRTHYILRDSLRAGMLAMQHKKVYFAGNDTSAGIPQ
jgi:hypothetical protein